ncbi:MAG: TonB-dependent receptor [Caulobacteraceae bacterium]|nr:TonB-dependent receptor [Caulobacteraceae bacterium]
MTNHSKRSLLAASAAACALIIGCAANAADTTAAPANSPSDAAGNANAGNANAAGNGSYGTRVEELIVTTQAQSKAADVAPLKANLNQTQPQSLISGSFIHNFTPEIGDYTTVVLIAPSVAGISTNGGGIGDTNKVTLRGFQDGQYNLTYDGIAFGDTNDPTHHPADYFPPSTIGAAVVDRGPGQAGDLGQANYGGAIHLFSPTVSDTFNIDQKATYGTWKSWEVVTTVNSGEITQTNGTKVLAVFDGRGSDGELTYSGGIAWNGLLKIVQPINPNWTVTAFSSLEYTRFYQSDANSGTSVANVLAYGKNFGLVNNPASALWYGFNHEKKNTDFEYIDLHGDLGHGVTLEDQFYTYYYSNKTISADDNSGIYGGPNTSPPKCSCNSPTDIGGYNKGNRYRVYGDILRVNDDFKWDWLTGSIKAGALIEGAITDRHNILYDLTTGAVDNNKKYGLKTNGPLFPGPNGNVKTAEDSGWIQYQLFSDFVLRPTDNLTITPGIKFVDFERSVEGVENSVNGPVTRAYIKGSNTYQKPLYFFTANYRVLPYWSVYAQYATGFLVPSLSFLYSDALSLQNLKPATTTNYQIGTVYSRGNLAADGDVYWIHGNGLEQPCPGVNQDGAYCNIGTSDYSGVEGQLTYALPLGFTAFANGSINTAKNKTTDQTELNAPKWTDAFGIIWDYRGWQAAMTYKEVGAQVGYIDPANVEHEIGAYNTTNAIVSYDFGKLKVKLTALNIFDHRDLTNVGAAFTSKAPYTLTPSSFVQFQAGREILVTLEAKFH